MNLFKFSLFFLFSMLGAMDERSFEDYKRSLDAGADPNATIYQYTIFSLAASSNQLALAQLFLEYGADVDCAYQLGMTALMDVAQSDKSPEASMAKLLINHGADITKVDDFYKWTPMGWAETFDNVPVWKLLAEVTKFQEFPIAAIEKHKADGDKLHQYLIWSIAQKNLAAYNYLKKIKPEWFESFTKLAIIMLHAAKVGNDWIVRDVTNLLKTQNLELSTRKQLYLSVFKYLAKRPTSDAIREILAEGALAMSSEQGF